MSSVADYYNRSNEEIRLVQSRANQLEYLTTMHYILQYIDKSSTIADIGAGAGIYSIPLAEKAKKIYAVDISSHHISQIEAKKHSQGLSNIVAIESDILMLGQNSEKYDVVLCLGPLYHLQKRDERIKALEVCRGMLGQEGKLFLAYINRHAAIQIYIKNKMFPDRQLYKDLSEKGFNPTGGFDHFMDLGFFSDENSVKAEVEEAGLVCEKNIGVDGAYKMLKEELELMTEEQWKAFYEYHLSTCEDRSIAGLSNHGLMICRLR